MFVYQNAKVCLAMDNSSTGLVTATRARVKIGLAVYLSELRYQNWLSIFGQFLGPVKNG